MRPAPRCSPWRVARRDRVADRAPGPDDPRLGRRHRARGARRPDPALASGSRPSTTCSPTSTVRLHGVEVRAASLDTTSRVRRLRLDVHQGGAGRRRTEGRIVARPRTPPRSTPTCSTAGTRAWRELAAPTRAPSTRRCSPARRPAAGFGSPWSATRSWSPPRPAGGSPCPAAAGWCTSRAAGCPRTGLRELRQQRAGRGAARRRHGRRQRRGPARPCAAALARRGGAARSWSPATSTPGTRSRAVLADLHAVRAGRQRRAAHRGARARIGPRRDPRDVPAPRDRRQAPVEAGRLHRRWSAARPRTWCSPPSSCWPADCDAEHPGAGDVVVVDVGGATTDVHSVVELDPEDAGLAREVVATLPVTRTVEGDLGMRWSAVSTVEEGRGRVLARGAEAARRARSPGDPSRPRRRAARRRRADRRRRRRRGPAPARRPQPGRGRT